MQIWLLEGKRIHAFVHLQICIFRLIEEKKNIFQSVAIENENASLSIVGCGFGISVLHSLDHRSPLHEHHYSLHYHLDYPDFFRVVHFFSNF